VPSGEMFGQSSARDRGRLSGGAVVAGGTTSADVPAVGGLQTELRGTEDAFVVKLAPSGTSFVYSTLFGGSAADEFTDLAVAPTGEVYAAGTTMSVDLPVRNAVQPSFWGATFDMFAVKLNADVSQVRYATYLGGSGDESGPSLAVARRAARSSSGRRDLPIFRRPTHFSPFFGVAAAAGSMRTHSSRNSVRMDRPRLLDVPRWTVL
jgi:hypothetical protein